MAENGKESGRKEAKGDGKNGWPAYKFSPLFCYALSLWLCWLWRFNGFSEATRGRGHPGGVVGGISLSWQQKGNKKNKDLTSCWRTLRNECSFPSFPPFFGAHHNTLENRRNFDHSSYHPIRS